MFREVPMPTPPKAERTTVIVAKTEVERLRRLRPNVVPSAVVRSLLAAYLDDLEGKMEQNRSS